MSIFFDGCTEFPCIVHQGTTATGQLTMKANAATETLTCKVGDLTIVSYFIFCSLDCWYYSWWNWASIQWLPSECLWLPKHWRLRCGGGWAAGVWHVYPNPWCVSQTGDYWQVDAQGWPRRRFPLLHHSYENWIIYKINAFICLLVKLRRRTRFRETWICPLIKEENHAHLWQKVPKVELVYFFW